MIVDPAQHVGERCTIINTSNCLGGVAGGQGIRKYPRDPSRAKNGRGLERLARWDPRFRKLEAAPESTGTPVFQKAKAGDEKAEGSTIAIVCRVGSRGA
jgi:hypothetical protein